MKFFGHNALTILYKYFLCTTPICLCVSPRTEGLCVTLICRFNFLFRKLKTVILIMKFFEPI